MFLINSKYDLNKPLAVFMENLLSCLYAICLLLSYFNLKVAFVFFDRATAVCTFIFAAQGTLACNSLLQVLGMTESIKTLSISFSSTKTNLTQKWSLNLLACSVKQSGWLAVQVFKRKDFLWFKISQTPVGAPSYLRVMWQH